MENRTIFLPRKAAEKLMEQAARDVKASSGGGTSPAPFISEGDILTTWCSKLACLGLSPKSNRPVSMINTVDVRSRIKNVFDPAAAYVQNLGFPCWVLSSVREIVSKAVDVGPSPLWNDASWNSARRGVLRLRRSIVTSGGDRGGDD